MARNPSRIDENFAEFDFAGLLFLDGPVVVVAVVAVFVGAQGTAASTLRKTTAESILWFFRRNCGGEATVRERR